MPIKILSLCVPLCIILAFQFSYAQPICGFDNVHAQRMKTGIRCTAHRLPAMKTVSGNTSKHIKNLSHSAITTNSTGGSPGTSLSTALYTIPVVVHVVHTGGAVGTIYNPNRMRRYRARLTILTSVYNGTYPGTQGVGDFCQIQFAIAKRDPNCNPTNGINRVDGSSISGYVSGGVNANTTLGTDEINVKNFIRWDPTQYYNIWVVDKIDGADGTSGQFIAGFAYFPGGDPNYDGIIMLATQMVTGQKTLPHEIGHAFNLYHPSRVHPITPTAPVNGNCNTDGDQVCDTDPITYNQNGGVVDFTCRTGINSCTGTAYSSNTESNYMNYTYCYTLFTAGQKTRMLASAAGSGRLSLSESLGATAPNAGTPTCAPKINFEISADQVTETPAATSGCRTYKDYTYNMVIGTGPSVTATATLSVTSGTATEVSDFDITTNGSFSSPSKVLTFPAGSVVSQPFTIRIYDDASVEGTESFTLGFTVNNGGGDAVAGDGRPSLTIIINDNDSAPTNGTTSGTANIGSAVYTPITATPFDATQQSQRVQFLYKASELTAAGVPAGSLTGISLAIQSKLSTRAFTGLTINLGTASVAYLVNGSVTLGSGMTTVKTTTSYNTVAGWNNFVFDTPFTWDGTSNLVVELCFNNSATAAGDAAADQVLSYSDGGSASQGNIFWQSGINCSQSFSSVNYYGNGVKPVIQLAYGIPATAVQTVLNSSKQEYLGPNADIYFYDQVNSKLMARIQNLSAFDYGCTQVTIDRAGTSATAFWNNTVSNYIMDKTFHVVPTNNNATGSYMITLYYTQAEINGWLSATGQNITNISLIKTANQTSLVTPSNPTGAGTMVTGSPVTTTLGTNTALTYNFTTGFSGFGAGVIGVILPVASIDLQGHLNNDNVVLNWSTASEVNSREFDVERSYDGNNFLKIGSVAASGNSTVTTNYLFKDPDIAQQDNYYRLKEIDNDNASGYSKVVLVERSNGDGAAFKVLNNPFTNSLDVQLGKEAYGKTETRLLDITGKELYHFTNNANGITTMHIDLSQKNISSGMYILELWFNNESHVAKVIKQ